MNIRSDAAPYRDEVKNMVDAVQTGDPIKIQAAVDVVIKDQLSMFSHVPQTREALHGHAMMAAVGTYLSATSDPKLHAIAHHLQSFAKQSLDPTLVATREGFHKIQTKELPSRKNRDTPSLGR